jgi:hypothetical protein
MRVAWPVRFSKCDTQFRLSGNPVCVINIRVDYQIAFPNKDKYYSVFNNLKKGPSRE